jgi:PIN domain nuclease of toxin-antitoxin system
LFEIAVKQNIGKTPELNWDTETIVKQIQKDKFDLLNIQNQHIQE